MLTLLWSYKEAVYKWYGREGVDFKSHIIINNISINDTRGRLNAGFESKEEI
jgi:hypothetical protein